MPMPGRCQARKREVSWEMNVCVVIIANLLDLLKTQLQKTIPTCSCGTDIPPPLPTPNPFINAPWSWTSSTVR